MWAKRRMLKTKLKEPARESRRPATRSIIIVQDRNSKTASLDFSRNNAVEPINDLTQWYVDQLNQDTIDLIIVGTQTSAPLLSLVGHDERIQVSIAPPAVIGRRYLDRSAEDQVQRAARRLLTDTPLASMVRRATEQDRLLVDLYLANKPATARNILSDHPAGLAFAFAGWADPVAARRLILSIFHPKFFRIPLGERPKDMNAWLDLDRPTVSLSHLANPEIDPPPAVAAVRAWAKDSKGKPESAYFWRIFSRAPDEQQGVLRASRALIDLVRSLWIDSLSPQQLFAPEIFFKGDKAAFRRFAEIAAAPNN